MKTQVIVAAAGKGERLGASVAKPFVLLNAKPLVAYALNIFEACETVDSVIVAVDANDVGVMQSIIDQEGFNKVLYVIPGGATRSESVKNALEFIDENTDYVAVHDGARPLITTRFINEMIEAAPFEDALVAAVPVKPTIKQADPQTLIIEKTLDRSCLWDIQTPQIFKRDVILAAYNQQDLNATDDAALVERMGKIVKIFPGLEKNIKVTTPQDLLIAGKFLNE